LTGTAFYLPVMIACHLIRDLCVRLLLLDAGPVAEGEGVMVKFHHDLLDDMLKMSILTEVAVDGRANLLARLLSQPCVVHIHHGSTRSASSPSTAVQPTARSAASAG